MNIFAPRVTVMALAIASALTFNVTAQAAPAAAATTVRAENAYLSQQDAAARSARVSNVDYALEFTLTGKPGFSGVRMRIAQEYHECNACSSRKNAGQKRIDAP